MPDVQRKVTSNGHRAIGPDQAWWAAGMGLPCRWAASEA